MAERAYCDWNATTPLRDEASVAMMATWGPARNASSVHSEGRAARQIVEKARAQVAAMLGAAAPEVTFTSGATEANALALNGFPAHDRLFISAVEHPAVKAGGNFPADAIEEVPVDSNGIIHLDALRRRLARSKHPLVSVMLANNETGVIQPIADVADIVHAANGVLHVDAVQGIGKIECQINDLKADLLSLTGHKFGGPQGAGALVRRGDVTIKPVIRGGGQERGLRAGTENVAAIAGLGAACAAVTANWRTEAAHMAALRDRVEAAIKAKFAHAVIFGEGAPRLPNTTLFAIPGIKAETALIAFDLAGIALSAGSACSSGKVQGSAVLAAMGVEPALAQGALRISLGRTTTDRDVENLLDALIKVSSSLLKRDKNSRLNSGLAAGVQHKE